MDNGYIDACEFDRDKFQARDCRTSEVITLYSAPEGHTIRIDSVRGTPTLDGEDLLPETAEQTADRKALFAQTSERAASAGGEMQHLWKAVNEGDLQAIQRFAQDLDQEEMDYAENVTEPDADHQLTIVE